MENLKKIFTPEVSHLIQVETLRHANYIKNDPLFSLCDGELKALFSSLPNLYAYKKSHTFTEQKYGRALMG